MNKNFLAKKSWHTGALHHIEKVWKAEQTHNEEQRKISLLKKELQEEQRIMELRKMADEASGKPKQEKVDWMYQIKRGPTADEYLKGQAIKKDEEKELEQLAKKPGALWIHSSEVNQTRDAEVKVRDDPMLQIKIEQQKALKNILNNPMQMKKIKETDQIKKLLKKLEKKKKKLEKKQKKEKKEKKENENESGKEESSSKSNSKSPSPTRVEDKRRRDRDESDKRSHDMVNENRRSDKDDSDKRNHDTVRENRRSDKDDSDRRSRDTETRRSDKGDRDRRNHDTTRENRRKRSRSRSKSRSRSPYKREATQNRYDRRVPENKQSSDQPNNRRGDMSKKMTEEERKRKLQEMVQDAEEHEDWKYKRIKSYSEDSSNVKNVDGEDNKHADFIDKMNRSVYTQHNEDLADRVRRNIHMIDRSTGNQLANEEKGSWKK